MDYFESQNNKDCVIHSLNNAFGRTVIGKEEILSLIESKVQRLVQGLLMSGASPQEISRKERTMRDRYSSGSTFFSADIVWEAAKNKGVYALHMPIPGVASPYVRMASFTPDILARPIVVLGGDGHKGTHAIAVRDGMIYDSERAREGPVPLSKDQLHRSLKRVFGAYVFLARPEDARIVREAASPIAQWNEI